MSSSVDNIIELECIFGFDRVNESDDIVVIDSDGNVYVNEELLVEPYVTEKSLGDCDLDFPYTVPGDGYFVMGDQRINSVDSRNSVIGAVTREDIIGKVYFRVWPLDRIGFSG